MLALIVALYVLSKLMIIVLILALSEVDASSGDVEMFLQGKYSRIVRKQQHCLDFWNKEVLSVLLKNYEKLLTLSKSFIFWNLDGAYC